MTLLLLAALLIATSLAWARRPFTQDEAQTWVFVSVMGTLLLLALAAPNPWVGLILAWCGCSLAWSALGSRWKIVQPGIAAPDAQITTQIFVGLGGALYLALTRLLRPADAPWWALLVLAWAVVNATAAVVSFQTGWRPAGWVRSEGTIGQAGYTQSPYFNAWLCSLGALAAIYLAVVWTPIFAVPLPVLGLGIWLGHSRAVLLHLVAGSAAFVALTHPFGGWIALGSVPILGAAIVATRHQDASWLLRLGAAWPAAWSNARRAHFWGVGLGHFPVIERKPFQCSGSQLQYRHAHNEYLHVLVELGPFPILCWLGYVVTAFLRPLDPHQAFALSLVVALSAYAILYFPLHVPAQAITLVTAMAFLEV